MSPNNDHHSSPASFSIEHDDYDNPWKEALERFMGPFIAFFLPDAYGDIDWSHPVDSLDTELRAVVREAELGPRRVDFLVRVRCKGGKEQLVLIHIEIQSQVDPELGKRLYICCNRIHDRYDLPVVSMAVLGARREGWDPGTYGWSLWGFEMGGRFPVYQMLDWQGREAELMADPNPFALVVLAHLKARETKGAPVQRRHWKMQIMRLLIERDYEKADAVELFRVLDWLMHLPKPEAQRFRTEYDELTKEAGMPYLSSIERLAMEEGHEKGFRQGIQQAAEQERRQLKTLVEKLIAQRFGQPPTWAQVRLQEAEGEALRRWGERLLEAPTLEALFEDGPGSDDA